MRAGVVRLMTMTTVVVAGALGAGSPASACSCASPTSAEAFEIADAVFVGELTEVRRPGSVLWREQEARFIFAVETVFKGEVFERQSIVTHAQGGACGLELEGPGPFLMFATESGVGGPSPDEGEFASALCSGNTRIGPKFTGDELGAAVAPLAGSSPAGAAGLSMFAWGLLGAVVALVGGLGLVVRSWLRRSTRVA